MPIAASSAKFFAMRTAVPEKLLAIVEDIDAHGSTNLTRLTVLKKWFERPGRLPAFGLWMAKRAAGQKGKTKAAAGAFLDEARALLGTTATRESFRRTVEPRAAKLLHDRARDFQNEFEHQQWGAVRIIHCWQLLLVEQGLALYLDFQDTPSDGYKLAADYCQHYDSRYGNSLNGPSRTKIREIVRFMFTIEAREELNGE
jgi:hypothetical protein